MVKPGGTGKPRLAISARPAPLPPSRLRMSARPSALPLPKRYTHLPLVAALAAGALPAAGLFGAGLLVEGLSVEGLAAAFDLASGAGLRPAPLRTGAGRAGFGCGRRDDGLSMESRVQRAERGSVDEMMDTVKARQPDDDEVDGDDIVQEPRNQQDQNASDECDQRRDMGSRDGHERLL